MLVSVSKAFVNEDAEAAAAAPVLPARPGHPSPITPGGHRRLQEERTRLLAEAEDAATQQRVQWLERVLGTVEVTEPQAVDGGAGFGCAVEVEDERGNRRTYVLVGPDEVDPTARRITADSPVGRALLGKKPGDAAELPRAGRLDDVTVTGVKIDDSSI
jgi:transcription elongation GreA/GreB family factor